MAKKLQLNGERFGFIVVLGEAYTRNRRVYLRCICDCGNKKTIASGHLRSGHTKSCGCLKTMSFSTEHKKKIGDANRGEKNHRFGKFGKDNPNYGSRRSEETKKRMSEAQKGEKGYWYGKHPSKETRKKQSELQMGNKNPNYNPNLTDKDRVRMRSLPEYKTWVRKVFELDRYTCQNCGQVSGTLNAHHIEGYNNNPKLRTEVSNGMTFCEYCHKDFHHRYGYGDNTRAQLIKFLRS